MHVTLVATNDDACSQFRLRWPEQALADTPGLTTEIVSEMPNSGGLDTVVVQRPLWRRIVDERPRLQQRGVAVAVDLDDDFDALHPEHPAYAQLDADTNAGQLVRACAAADVVTAPTQTLLDRYAPHGRGELIRNYLPRWALDVAERRDGRTIGWSGIAAHHPGDLEDTGGAVGAVLLRQDARFQVVGPLDGIAERLGLQRPASGTGMLPIRDYFQALGTIDVGIVPLGPTRFNEAKSTLKGLEWAAAGVPFVASPTPEYEWLASRGIGTIARSPQEWERKLTELLADEPLRRELAATGRRLVGEHFLLEQNAWRWPKAWERARAHRRAQG
jgi:glycosyltransferase involved in cell wall biosynthesis